jgi:Pregnancy-associated plasma protein-A/Secretion system C-terminal sorting domain/Fibronectin type III domain/Bacterial pre-peptidase C-terminal domain
MKQYWTLFLAIFVITFSLNAQTHEHHNCAAMEALEQQLQDDPTMLQRMEAIEQHTKNFVSKPQLHTRAVVTIPVVFHIVYRNATENISDALIENQIAVLNADFRKLNANRGNTPSVFSALAADVEVNFCLAQRSVDGNASTGIMRYFSSRTTDWGINDAVKKAASGGVIPWDASQYLNIWVCSIGEGVLGYAQFPGGSNATDGVVIDYKNVGNSNANAPFNLGRTATHEVGHWLNLRHIWGDASCGNDLVDDTPTQLTSNYGCPTFPRVTCGNGVNGDMFMNFMDYSNDACMTMFSLGQKARMQAVLSAGGQRASLATSNGCMLGAAAVCAAPTDLNVTNITSTSATISWVGIGGASNYALEYRTFGATTWTTVLVSSTNKTLTGLTANKIYEYRVKTNCAASTSAYATSTIFTTASSGICTASTNISAGNLTSTSATISWTTVSGAYNYALEYRVLGTATWTTLVAASVSQAITGLTASTTYEYRLKTNCSGVMSVYTTIATFATTAAICSDAYEPNNSLSTAMPLPANTTIQALISSATDNDYFSFSNTTAQPNIKITLSNIPTGKDYDLRLYNSAGTNIKSSLTSGTTAEKILYNVAPVGTYKVRVYPYSGFNTTACYTLAVNIGNTTFAREIDGNDTPFEEVKIIPNPVADVLNIEWHAEADAPVTIRLLDLTGREMKRIEKQMSKELTTVQMDVRNVQNGMYIVTLQQGEILQTKKVVVNH